MSHDGGPSFMYWVIWTVFRISRIFQFFQVQHGVPVLPAWLQSGFASFQRFECVESIGDPLLVILC